MRDNVVGIIGVLLVVGGMMGAIQLNDSSAADEEGSTTEGGTAPAPLGRTNWDAPGCRSLQMAWAPPIASLAPIVDPWEPAPGAVPGRGTLVLFYYECPDGSNVNGPRTGAHAGGAALVPILEPDVLPEGAENVTGPRWLAMPEAFEQADHPLLDVYEAHGFDATGIDVSLDVTTTPLGNQVTLTATTSEGSVSATALLLGAATDSTLEVAVLNTGTDRFGAMFGDESYTAFDTGTVAVQASGSTWVSRLGLEPAPVQVQYATTQSWSFQLLDVPYPP